MTADSAVRVAALLPDVLGTYSDAGNLTVLAQRLRWRGIPVEVCEVRVGSEPPVDCDLYLLGGGEDVAELFVADWLREHARLRAALAERATTLAVCAGLQVLGCWVQDSRGRRHPGAGIAPVTTAPGRRRAVGEVVSRCVLPEVGTLTGFENHRGVTVLEPGGTPLGRVVVGEGNGGGSRADGLASRAVVGTYLHGPVLARNPALADALLRTVTGGVPAPLELPDQPAVRRLRLAGAPVRLRIARSVVQRAVTPRHG